MYSVRQWGLSQEYKVGLTFEKPVNEMCHLSKHRKSIWQNPTCILYNSQWTGNKRGLPQFDEILPLPFYFLVKYYVPPHPTPTINNKARGSTFTTSIKHHTDWVSVLRQEKGGERQTERKSKIVFNCRRRDHLCRKSEVGRGQWHGTKL